MCWIKPGKPSPAVMTLRIPNDYDAVEGPEDGYSYLHSYMDKNDLVIGRVVEYLSLMKYWKNMAIVITEDDSQRGADHGDAHRPTGFVISLYSRFKKTTRTNYSQTSMARTIEQTLGLPPLNILDATALPMFDCFTEKADCLPDPA